MGTASTPALILFYHQGNKPVGGVLTQMDEHRQSKFLKKG